MSRWRRTTACERAAQWISLELDDEIAGLERAALARHLEHCDRCRSAKSEVGGFTVALRDAPLDGPMWPLVVTVPVRRRKVARVGIVALVAGVAVAGSISFLSGPSKPSTGALGFVSSQEQREFGEEHVNMEPTLFVVDTPPADSFGARGLR
jgi:predicted anti-sigma-YlaC factor YlaD